MNAKSLQKRVDNAFKRVGGMDRVVYIRSYTSDPTSDALTGRESSEFTDSLITPQPAYHQLAKREVMYLTNNGKKVSADDYKIDISPLAITDDILDDPTTEFVLKGNGSEEVLRIVYDNSVGYQGVTALYSVIARSVSNSA